VDEEEIEVPPSPGAELRSRWEGLESAEKPVPAAAAAAVEEAAVVGGKGMLPASVVSTQQHLYYYSDLQL
jgi:hypothetical protein